MNALPVIYLSWNQSTEPLASFLRYCVYRRELGEGENAWLRLARITDRSRTYFEDHQAGAGVTYEYAVTQVSDSSGEEVESDFPTPVQASLTINSLFIHDAAAPEHYAELLAATQEVNVEQDIAYLQPWSGQAPVAHVGNVEARTFVATVRGQWNHSNGAISREQYLALRNLQERQRTNGAVLVARQGRDIRLFCQLEMLRRADEAVNFSQSLRLKEVDYQEAVD